MTTGPRVAVDLRDFLANESTVLPPLIDAAMAAPQIASVHQDRGGSTSSLYFGDCAGVPLFAVAIFPERGRVWAGEELPVEVVQKFIEDNLDLLRDPRLSIGTWYNADNGRSYLDVSVTIPDRRSAEALGRRYNQIAIFDLMAAREIATDGAGSSAEGFPPAPERLPPIRRGAGG